MAENGSSSNNQVVPNTTEPLNLSSTSEPHIYYQPTSQSHGTGASNNPPLNPVTTFDYQQAAPHHLPQNHHFASNSIAPYMQSQIIRPAQRMTNTNEYNLAPPSHHLQQIDQSGSLPRDQQNNQSGSVPVVINNDQLRSLPTANEMSLSTNVMSQPQISVKDLTQQSKLKLPPARQSSGKTDVKTTVSDHDIIGIVNQNIEASKNVNLQLQFRRRNINCRNNCTACQTFCQRDCVRCRVIENLDKLL